MRASKFLLLPVASLATTLFLGAGVAHADGNAPAGNNGTIKIDGVPAEDGNDNKPHPGCQFTVEFFGYDAGDRTANLEFEGQAPTGGGMLLEDTQHFTVAERTGGNQLDHRAQYDLSSALANVTPHPKQGYHVKLTVHVDGAKGADVKHKVFWVSECAAAGTFTAEAPTTTVAPTTTTTAAPAPAPTPAPAPAVESNNGAAGGVVPSAAPSSASGEVLASEATAPSGDTGAAGGSLPRTGSSTAPLAATAVGLLAAGTALVAAGRRKQTA